MKVKDVMTRNCIYVSPDTTIKDAAQIMKDQDIGFIPVAEDDKMIGMVTDRDIAVRGIACGRVFGGHDARLLGRARGDGRHLAGVVAHDD